VPGTLQIQGINLFNPWLKIKVGIFPKFLSLQNFPFVKIPALKKSLIRIKKRSNFGIGRKFNHLPLPNNNLKSILLIT